MESPSPVVPAPVRRRIAAGVLDLAVLSVVVALMVRAAAGDVTSRSLLATLFWLVVLLTYYFAQELWWNGATLGKRAFGLQVVTTTGARADWSAVLTRTVVRIVDFFPLLYLTGILIIWVTGADRRQRLGDIAGGTVVIRSRPAPDAVDPRG